MFYLLQEYISPKAPLRRKLTVHVTPNGQNQNQPETENGTKAEPVENDCGEEEVDFPLPEVLV